MWQQDPAPLRSPWLPATQLQDHGVVRERLGRIARLREQFDVALSHDMLARACYEHTGDVLGQARTRYNVALDHQGLGRREEARVYATAAMAVFQSLGVAGEEGRLVSQRLCEDLGIGT